jgi:hypothetical protein
MFARLKSLSRVKTLSGIRAERMKKREIARVQAQGKNSGPASKTRYFVKRPFS